MTTRNAQTETLALVFTARGDEEFSPERAQCRRRIKTGDGAIVTIVYRPHPDDISKLTKIGEMWLCAPGAELFVSPDQAFRLVEVDLVAPLALKVGDILTLDLEQSDRHDSKGVKDWQSATTRRVGSAVEVGFVLDRRSENRPAGPGEKGRYVCEVTGIISRSPRYGRSGYFVEVSVAIISRVASARAVRRQETRSSGMPAATAKIV